VEWLKVKAPSIAKKKKKRHERKGGQTSTDVEGERGKKVIEGMKIVDVYSTHV
jgi:hypothetical protein